MKELREGVCNTGMCPPMREMRATLTGDRMANASTVFQLKETLAAYREDAPHVVTALRAECSFLHRLWFALGFVLFGFSRERMRRKEARGW